MLKSRKTGKPNNFKSFGSTGSVFPFPPFFCRVLWYCWTYSCPVYTCTWNICRWTLNNKQSINHKNGCIFWVFFFNIFILFCFSLARRPFRRHSMENMELMKLTPDKKVKSLFLVQTIFFFIFLHIIYNIYFYMRYLFLFFHSVYPTLFSRSRYSTE